MSAHLYWKKSATIRRVRAILQILSDPVKSFCAHTTSWQQSLSLDPGLRLLDLAASVTDAIFSHRCCHWRRTRALWSSPCLSGVTQAVPSECCPCAPALPAQGRGSPGPRPPARGLCEAPTGSTGRSPAPERRMKPEHRTLWQVCEACQAPGSLYGRPMSSDRMNTPLRHRSVTQKHPLPRSVTVNVNPALRLASSGWTSNESLRIHVRVHRASLLNIVFIEIYLYCFVNSSWHLFIPLPLVSYTFLCDRHTSYFQLGLLAVRPLEQLYAGFV